MSKRVRSLGRRRIALLALGAVLVAGLAWGISGAVAASESPAPETGKVVLKLGMTNIPDSLNVFTGQMSSSYEIWSLNYDLMVGFTASDYGHPKGDKATGLATDWSSTPDGKVWTFKIRTDAKWQDGVPVTARDVAFTYNYIIDNDISNYMGYLDFVTKVEATDDQTVVFTCSKPKGNMLNMWVYIVPEHIWSKIPGDKAGSTYQVKPPMVGSGPFQVTDYKKDISCTMTANKDYWRGAPTLDEVDFIYFQNADSMTQQLKAGALDGAWGVLDAQYQQLKNDPNFMALSYVTLSLEELGFNCYEGKSKGNPVLKDAKFRTALQWAVDHEKIATISYGGQAQPATSVLVSNFWKNPDWHWEPPADQKYTYDLAKAAAALDAAGYPLKDGKRVDKQGKPIELRLWARSSSQTQQQAAKLITSAFTDLGIKVQMSVMSDGAIMNGQYNMEGDTFVPDYDMFLWGWGGDPDPNFIMNIFLTSQINSWSDCAWSNAEYDKLFQQQQTTIDPTARKAVIDQMQQLLYEESPYIPTVYANDTEVVNVTKWEGWVHTVSPQGGVFFMSPIVDSYMNLKPKTSESDSGGMSTASIIGIVIGALIVIAIILWIVVSRRKPQAVEE